jgi:ABC-2 type transport system ATP-binding protein
MSLLIKNITKRFGSTITVSDLNLEIEKHQIYGFLGANGAGKTTMFRLILGILTPNNGTITWNGKVINYSNSDSVGYLPEERGLYAELPVRQQLIYFGQLRGLTKDTANLQIDYWLERFHISNYSNRRLQELSKGNQQKIQFISAVLHSPELLLLDEPFSGLDPVNVEQLKNAVKHLANQGTTILFSSHRMEHVEELCESLCLLDKGEAILEGNFNQIKREFGNKNIHLKTTVNLDFLKDYSEVTGIIEKADKFIINLKDESFSHKILQELIARGEVYHFSLEEPSLNDIFIEKVGMKYE